MTETQKHKSAWLSRPNVIRYSLISEYGLSANDKKRAANLIAQAPKEAQKEVRKILDGITAENEKRYIEIVNLYEKVRRETEAAISGVDYKFRWLLISHYLDGQNWNAMARTFGMSLRNLKYRHITALDMVSIEK